MNLKIDTSKVVAIELTEQEITIHLTDQTVTVDHDAGSLKAGKVKANMVFQELHRQVEDSFIMLECKCLSVKRNLIKDVLISPNCEETILVKMEKGDFRKIFICCPPDPLGTMLSLKNQASLNQFHDAQVKGSLS
jgi:hypothetical protein